MTENIPSAPLRRLYRRWSEAVNGCWYCDKDFGLWRGDFRFEFHRRSRRHRHQTSIRDENGYLKNVPAMGSGA